MIPPARRRRHRRRLPLLASLAMSAIFAVVFAVNVDVARARDIDRQQLRVIVASMNRSVPPCEDFYEYACGNWSSQHTDAEYYENIGYVDHKINQKLANMLKEVRHEPSYRAHKFVRNLVHHYRSCRSLSEYDPRIFLQWLVDNENVRWPPPMQRPLQEGAPTPTYDWMHLLATLRRYGLNGVLVEESVQAQANNTRASIIDMDKPVLRGGFQPMTRSSFDMQTVYLHIDSDEEADELWQQVSVLEAALKSLADAEPQFASAEGEAEGEVEPRVATLRELDLPWLERYLSNVLRRRHIDRDTPINIQNLPYFRHLFALLEQYEPAVISRYLMLRFMVHLHQTGPRHFMKQYCVEHVRSILPLAMHWLYEQKMPGREALLADSANIVRMFRRLRKYFRQQLQTNIYQLDGEVLQSLLDKVDMMRIKIGNLPRPNTDDKLAEFYAELTLGEGNFYSNLLHVLAFQTHAEHRQLRRRQPAAINELFHMEDMDTASISSPYYMMRYNVVVVPLTLLRPPVYHPAMDEVYKYSLLGFLLAHEIMHGFDNSGLELDKQGYENYAAVAIKDNQRFDRNLNCLRQKNPAVLDEKIADVSGLRWAFEAYFTDNEANGLRSSTAKAAAAAAAGRGLFHSVAATEWAVEELSNERLFFLNFAQFFCGSANEEDFDFSEHGSDRQRVLDTLSNFQEFARVFRCAAGTPMNPQRKCQLWR